ncbi:MAG: hypothetical protein Q9157_002004 [Trypethelium eluteriae]
MAVAAAAPLFALGSAVVAGAGVGSGTRQSDKWRKEVRSQANEYAELLRKELLPHVGSVAGSAKSVADTANSVGSIATKWAPIVGCSLTFAAAAAGLANLYKAYTGADAQKKLQEFQNKLGRDVEDIKHSLKSISTDVQELVSHKAQHDFPEHVYDYVKMRSDQIATQSDKHYLFVFHQGNEWRPAFHRLNEANPLPYLLGIFEDLNVLGACLRTTREVVGPDPVFHVLMPATRLFMVPDTVAIPQELQPLSLEGELQDSTGKPYNYLNVPDASDGTLLHIYNTANKEQPQLKKPSPWKKVASTSAAWGAGVPLAMAAAAGGCAAGPLGGIAAGATTGTMVGKGVGAEVEQAWDKNNSKE